MVPAQITLGPIGLPQLRPARQPVLLFCFPSRPEIQRRFSYSLTATFTMDPPVSSLARNVYSMHLARARPLTDGLNEMREEKQKKNTTIQYTTSEPNRKCEGDFLSFRRSARLKAPKNNGRLRASPSRIWRLFS